MDLLIPTVESHIREQKIGVLLLMGGRGQLVGRWTVETAGRYLAWC